MIPELVAVAALMGVAGLALACPVCYLVAATFTAAALLQGRQD